MKEQPVIKIETERVFTITVGSHHLGGMREIGRTSVCCEYENDHGERLVLFNKSPSLNNGRFQLLPDWTGEMPNTVVIGGSTDLLKRIGLLPKHPEPEPAGSVTEGSR